VSSVPAVAFASAGPSKPAQQPRPSGLLHAWAEAAGVLCTAVVFAVPEEDRRVLPRWIDDLASSSERQARPTQHLINRCCGWIDQTVGTVATPANCVTCAPFMNHTATLPFAQ